MARQKIYGARPFLVNASRFAISPSAQAYTLEYCADFNWETMTTKKGFESSGKPTAIGEITTVETVPGLVYRLNGNTDTLEVIFGKTE